MTLSSKPLTGTHTHLRVEQTQTHVTKFKLADSVIESSSYH